MRHFRPRFFNFDNCQPEVVSDVISSVIVETMGVMVRVKCGDSRSNCCRDIRLPHFITNDDDDDDNDNNDDEAGRWTLCQ